MEPNPNPPSERAWTIEEQEEFFKSQDAIKMDAVFEDAKAFLTNDPMYSQIGNVIDFLSSTGIHVTSIVPPEQGWPIALYCPLCRETTFILSPWAIKPEDRDYWHIGNMCASEVLGFEHNMRLGMKGYHEPIELKPGPLDWGRT